MNDFRQAWRTRGGQMGREIADLAWGDTPLGPIENWPSSLTTLVDLMLGSRQPVYIGWGADILSLYNDGYIPILGEKHPSALGQPFHTVFAEIWEEYGPLMRDVMAGEGVHRVDQPVALAARPGRPMSWFTFSWTPVRGENGAVAGFYCAATETTEKVRAEQEALASKDAAAREMEVRYRTLFDTIETGFCVVEVDLGDGRRPIDYRVIEANPAFYEQTGFPEAIFGLWLREAAPALEEHWYQTYGEVARTGAPKRFEQHSEHLGRWFDVYAFRAEAAEKSRVGILFSDITARREAQDRLKDLNETLEGRVRSAIADRDRAWNNARDLMVVVDDAGRIRASNPAWRNVLGWEPAELLDRSILEFVHGEDRAATEAALLAPTAPSPAFENRCRRRDGSYRLISWVAAPEGDMIYGSGRDITHDRERQIELEAAQEALKQSQKMEAVGQLTGGIAHDFNNLLGAVMGGFDLILRKPGDADRVRKYAEAGLQAAERGARLTGQLLAFSRAQKIQLRPLIVADIVAQMTNLLTSTLGPLVRLDIDVDGEGQPVMCDAVQLEMALLNLAINARDAMPEGGRLTIKSRTTSSAGTPDLVPGGYLELIVSDTGSGMTPEVAARAFEPFFTTKGVGEGTGLGLSQVYGIARQAGGAVRIESTPGQGTAVSLYLPITDAFPEAGEPAEDASEAETRDRRPQILVIDDDDHVRRMTVDQLEALGYQTLCAPDGREGLKLLASHPPDLLLVDFAMPEMNGAEVARRALERWPALPVVFASGFADTDAITTAVGPEACVLRKPFRMEALRETLAQRLDRRTELKS